MTIPHWLRRWLLRRLVDGVAVRRPPDVVIGGEDSPYLRRWWLIPRNRVCNVYLHHFLRSDDDRALHDHPWASISVILAGPGYEEVVADGHPSNPARHRYRTWPVGSVIVRLRARHAHRIALLPITRIPHPMGGVELIGEHPVWTLFITGPRVREWGFWCPHGWRHWRDFTAGPRGETIDRGCE